MQNDIFEAFCRYVDEHIFSKENIGSYVSFIVDQHFIDDFCKENNTTEESLKQSVRDNFNYKTNYSLLEAKGVIAIQLYAASKRINSDGLTAKAYYIRLSETTGIDKDYLEKTWMPRHQDKIWSLLYRWCDRNRFRITKNERRSGSYCYVQYPLNQAKHVFTEEDLLYIAKFFVDRKLFPGEDITYRDFKEILRKYDLTPYVVTNHGIDVIYNSLKDEDYKSQIYNFYLRWNGKYKLREKIVHTDSTLNDVYAYLTDDLTTLELRNENLKLLQSYLIESMNYTDFANHFPIKRTGLLLFKKDDVYDNRWQEVRYIDADEEDYTKDSGNYGILIRFRHIINSEIGYKLRECEILFKSPKVTIYKITKSSLTNDFFTEKRGYELYGGLKIGRNSYLDGGTPILRIHKASMVWIDGKAVAEESIVGDYQLNNLNVGSHFIKLPNCKRLEINIVDVSASILEWEDNYNKWQIKKEPAKWESKKQEQGIIGLDFSLLSDSDNTLDGSITKRWAKALTFGKYHKSENNIAINITKQYDERV